MEHNRAFADCVPVPRRSGKPRETGVTMMIDWGMGPIRQNDMLRLVQPFVDIAKIAVGISGLIDASLLREKVSIYQGYDVDPFIGGMFLEYAIHHKGFDVARSYFEECVKLGFKTVEISDNSLEMKFEDKFRLIRTAHEQFGLKVLGEVGSKTEMSSTEKMVEGIRGCLQSGAWKVFVEGAEFVDKEKGGLAEHVIDGIVSRVDLNQLLFELPGIWIPKASCPDIHEMTVYFIKRFGPEVNIANVMPDWVLELETLRAGVGVLGVH